MELPETLVVLSSELFTLIHFYVKQKKFVQTILFRV